MTLVDTRVIPLASLRLFDAASGDPHMSDRGFNLYSPMLGFNGGTLSQAEFLDGAGLVCLPNLVLQNTRLTNYTALAGSWEERRPSAGIRKYRLIQYDTTANLQWSIRSKFPLPRNPHVLFEYQLFDAPSDFDTENYPPFIRFELGGGWGVEDARSGGANLVRHAGGGSWETVTQLSQPETLGGADSGTRTFLVRHFRNRIFISADYGRNYTWFGHDSTAGAEIPASTYTVRGQGGMCIFGLHQIRYLAGSLESPTWDGQQARLVAIPTIDGRYNTPGGTSVSFTDLSNGLTREVQWRATLTPAPVAGVPFTFYESPELYAVRFRYPVIRALTYGDYTTPWDNDLTEIEIDKPLALDGASATVTVYSDAVGQLVGSALRWRKVALLLGEYNEDASSVLTGTFVGYIRRAVVEQGEYNLQRLRLEIENVTVAAKRQQWSPFEVPLGGQTVNQALDDVLDSMGFTAAHRNWHPGGNFIFLPSGSPEEPFLWPKHGDNKYATMSDIAEWAGFELVGGDDGVWSTVPLEYVDPVVSHVYEASPASDATYAIAGLTFGHDAQEAATAVVATGKDEWGNPIWAFGVDSEAEENPASARFCPWRETVTIPVEGTTTVGWLARVVQSEFLKAVALRFESDLRVPAKLGVLRRNRVRVEGVTVGIDSADEFVVLSIKHSYRASIGRCETVLGLRRLGP